MTTPPRTATPPLSPTTANPLPPSAPPPAKWDWSDPATLEYLRRVSDPEAEACVLELKALGVTGLATHEIFKVLKETGRLPADTPEPLRRFFGANLLTCDECGTPRLPGWVDRDRIIRGQVAFNLHSLTSILVLLCKSLPEGYAAPSMTRILHLSKQLETHAYRRLMGTLELLVTVATPYSFERPGKSQLVGQEMRLMHAAVRLLIAPRVMEADDWNDYTTKFGRPASQLDMLGTLIGFSLLVVDGLAKLGVQFSDEDAEGYFYAWRAFGALIGIHPPGDPNSDAHLPATLADARTFYATYRAMSYVGATSYKGNWRAQSIAENPHGVSLAAAHVDMIANLINHGRILRFGRLTRVWMHELIGEEACARIGIEKVPFDYVLRKIAIDVPRWWNRVWSRSDSDIHMALSRWFLKRLIHGPYPKGFTYLVPMSLKDIIDVVQSPTFGRK